MALFDQILGAIANPSQQGSSDQLGSILNAVQQLASGSGVDASTTQVLLSEVGNVVRSSLQQQQAIGGPAQAESFVNQLSGGNFDPAVLQALIPIEQQRQLANLISSRTGLPEETILSLLPSLVSQVMTLLQSGSSQSGAAGGNSVLSAFLDSDRDGDVDVGDALSMAGRFLSQPR